MPARTRKPQGPPATTYPELVTAMPPRPLHDATDYENAVEMLDRLIGHELNAEQEDYMEAIATFVERYEREHAETWGNTRPVSGLATLRTLLERVGMSGADLARLLGVSPNMGPMILRGERAITAAHARTLGKHFRMDPGAFVR